MIRRILLLALAGALLAGCSKATPWPGHGPEGQGNTPPPVNVPTGSNPATPPTPTTPPSNTPVAGGTHPLPLQPAQPPAQNAIPGDAAALEQALSNPSPLSYSIEIVSELVVDPAKYLDERLTKGAPGANELLLLLFKENGWNLYFGLGPMDPPLSPDQVFAQVRAHYQTKARAGDPAGGLAELINALGQGR